MAVHHGFEILLKVTWKSDYRVKANKSGSLDCHLGIHCVRLGSLFIHSGVNTSFYKGLICSDNKKHTHICTHAYTHMKDRLSQIFGQQFEQDHHSPQMADHFALHREHLFAHLWTFYTTVLQFLRSLHFSCKSSYIIQNAFPQHSCF
jgi:hypothetical protein